MSEFGFELDLMRVLRVDFRGEKPGPLSDTIETFRKWLHLPDSAALLVVLGTVAANRLEGDPVWTVLVGPPAAASRKSSSRSPHSRTSTRPRP